MRGTGSYRGFRFEVKSSHHVTVKPGAPLLVEAIAWESGGAETPVEQRPAIRYVDSVVGIAAPVASAAVPPAASQPAPAATHADGGAR